MKYTNKTTLRNTETFVEHLCLNNCLNSENNNARNISGHKFDD